MLEFKKPTLDDVIDVIGGRNDVLGAFFWGSRVYGTNRPGSDWDVIAVVGNEIENVEALFDDVFLCTAKEAVKKKSHGVSRGRVIACKTRGVEVTVVSLETWQRLIEEHRCLALETLFLSSEFILKPLHIPFEFDLRMHACAVEWEAGRTLNRAKKKLAGEDLPKGRKELFHSMRYLEFGRQIAQTGRIERYDGANSYWQEISKTPLEDLRAEDWIPCFKSLFRQFQACVPSTRLVSCALFSKTMALSPPQWKILQERHRFGPSAPLSEGWVGKVKLAPLLQHDDVALEWMWTTGLSMMHKMGFKMTLYQRPDQSSRLIHVSGHALCTLLFARHCPHVFQVASQLRCVILEETEEENVFRLCNNNQYGRNPFGIVEDENWERHFKPLASSATSACRIVSLELDDQVDGSPQSEPVWTRAQYWRLYISVSTHQQRVDTLFQQYLIPKWPHIQMHLDEMERFIGMLKQRVIEVAEEAKAKDLSVLKNHEKLSNLVVAYLESPEIFLFILSRFNTDRLQDLIRQISKE